MLKTLTKILVTIALVLFTVPIAFAAAENDDPLDQLDQGLGDLGQGVGRDIPADPGAEQDCPDLKECTFSVGENLILPDGQQSTTFFQDDSAPPVVNFVNRVINFALTIIGSIAVILVIVAGFLMIFSRGDEQTLTTGKEMLKYVIIGLVVSFLSYVLIIFVQSIFTTA